MKLEDILNEYESKDKFSTFELSSALSNLDASEAERFETKSEKSAMAFSDNSGEKYWGTFYGPFTTWQDKKTKQEILVPDKSDITADDISYWTRRSKVTKSPILKMRYTGLVWDFGKEVTGKEPDFREIKLKNIRACIEIVEKDLADYSVSGLVYISHAIDNAVSLKQKDLIERAIKAMILYSRKYSKDEFPGIWAQPFQMMIKYMEHFKEFETDLVSEHQERFTRLESKCQETYLYTDEYVFYLKDEAELLCDYYQKKGDTAMIEECLNCTLQKLKLFFNLRGSMWSQGMLQAMQAMYRKYRLYRNANCLYLDIQKLGKSIFKEMMPNNVTVPLDKKELDKYFDYFMEGTDQEIIEKYILNYIPNLKKEKEYQKLQARQSPLSDLVKTVVYDWSGMPINNIGVGLEAEHQKFIYGMYTRMLISSTFIQIHIKRMEDKKTYTYESVMHLLKELNFLQEDQIAIVDRGVKAYFAGDFIVACHLLVIQFEAAIRNLAIMTGHEVLRANKNAECGNEYISLDGLLEEIQKDGTISQDLFTYYKTVFTDKIGWNVRNLVCHGALQASAFNVVLADRIVHAFMTLSLIKLVPPKEASSKG